MIMNKLLKSEWIRMLLPAIITVVVLGLQAWRAQAVSEEHMNSFMESNKVAHETIVKSLDDTKVHGTQLSQQNSRQIAELTGILNGLTTTVDRLSRDVYRRPATQ